MGNYIQTFQDHRQSWLQTCKKRHGVTCNVGDNVKLTTSNSFINEELFQYFGDKTYKVIRVIGKKWDLMPCDNYLVLQGLSGMFLNTIFENG